MPKIPPALRRLLSIALFASLVYFGARVFAVESADCEIVFRLRGPQIEKLVELEVRLMEEDDDHVLAEFRQYYQKGSTTPLGRWPLVIAEGSYRLVCDFRIPGESFTATVPVKLVDGEAVSVYIDSPAPRE